MDMTEMCSPPIRIHAWTDAHGGRLRLLTYTSEIDAKKSYCTGVLLPNSSDARYMAPTPTRMVAREPSSVTLL